MNFMRCTGKEVLMMQFPRGVADDPDEPGFHTMLQKQTVAETLDL